MSGDEMDRRDRRAGESLTDAECEQLLAGQELPGSAVSAVFAALNSSVEAERGAPLPGEAAAMAAFRTQLGAGRTHHRFTARIAAVGITGGLVLAGGVAAAATGDFSSIRHAITGHSSHHSTAAPTITPSPTPPATGSVTSATPGNGVTGPNRSGLHGKAHAGHGKGHGVGETAQPTHPAHPVHPSHPAHPTQAASPTHPAHPTKKAHPTQAANPTHPAKPSAHPTKKPHPTQAATPTHSPHPNHTPSHGHNGL
jgi:cell division septation protein DedD